MLTEFASFRIRMWTLITISFDLVIFRIWIGIEQTIMLWERIDPDVRGKLCTLLGLDAKFLGHGIL